MIAIANLWWLCSIDFEYGIAFVRVNVQFQQGSQAKNIDKEVETFFDKVLCQIQKRFSESLNIYWSIIFRHLKELEDLFTSKEMGNHPNQNQVMSKGGK